MDRGHIRDKRYEAYSQELHLKKVAEMKPAIDNKSPPTFPHLDNRSKSRQMESERLSAIEKENTRLVKKMGEIKGKPSTLDNHNDNKYKKSMNAGARQREQEKIEAENQAIVKRMQTNPPSYSKTKWDEERDKQLKYLKNKCEFPVLDHHIKIGSGVGSPKSSSPKKTSAYSTSPSKSPIMAKKTVTKSPATTKKTTTKKKVSKPTEDEDDEDDDDPKEEQREGAKSSLSARSRPLSTTGEQEETYSLSDSDTESVAKDDKVYKPESDSDLEK